MSKPISLLIVMVVLLSLSMMNLTLTSVRATQNDCESISVDNLDELEVTTTFDYDDVLDLAWSHDGNQLGIAAGRSGVFIHDLKVSASPIIVSTDPAAVVAFSPNGEFLAFGYLTINLENIETQEMTVLSSGDVSDWIRSIAFSPDSARLASLTFEDGTVRLWNVETGQQLASMENDNSFNVGHEVIFSSDGTWLLDATGYLITMRNADSLEKIFDDEFSSSVLSIDFNSQRNLIAAISSDFALDVNLIFWDAEGLTEISTLPAYSGGKDLSFSPDGRLLAVTDENGIYIWDMENEETLTTPFSALKHLEGDNSELRIVEFSPDGKFLASASQDNGTVMVWGVCAT